MPASANFRTLDGNNGGWHLDRLPDECPICHAHISAVAFLGVTNDFSAPMWGELVIQCTNRACQKLFIAEYRPTQSGQATYERSYPVTPLRPPIPDSVASVSPAFVDIYSQALAAEQQFPQLTGMGLRRAIEFLIKDFARTEMPRLLEEKDPTLASAAAPEREQRIADETEKMLKANLAGVIRDYIDNPQVRFAASRAVWLGNDETHYVRLWTDHDLRDLKTLIRLTTNFLDSVLLAREYARTMAEPRK